MSELADDYRRQFELRDWRTALDALPPLRGQRVLDLGCGVGDLALEMARAGACVVGVDANEELLEYARARQIPGAEFRAADLREAVDFGIQADGIWCSFAAAYFVDFAGALSRWKTALKPGGWIAVTEIDDLFGHEPLSDRTNALLGAYCEEGFAAGRYDFQAGRKIKEHLERAGFCVTKWMELRDWEFAFDGPSGCDVAEAWQRRLERMKLLQDATVKEEFLQCLTRPDHRSHSRVIFCLATAA